MSWLWKGLASLLILALCLGGLQRLRLETDVLGVLPQSIPEVASLRTYQKNFAQDQEIIVLCTAADPDEGIDPDEVDALSEALEKAFPEFELKGETAIDDSADQIASLTAYLWLNSPQAEVDELLDRLNSQEDLDSHLAQVLQRIRTSSDQEETTRLSYDPLGFLNHPALNSLFQSDYSFSSEDGNRQLIVLSSSAPPAGYRKDTDTVAKLRQTIARQQPGSFTTQLTGGPIFSSEIGSSMEGDMSGTVSVTCLLIGSLFLLLQRSLKQLAAVGLCVGIVFLTTLGLAGWLIGSLNLISVGFAAILIGLAIDYAVVILRESRPDLSPQALQKAVAPSVLWAALTTSAVFGTLGFSSFVGVAQLGQLLAIGLTTGAVLMLLALPHLSKTRCNRQLALPEPRMGKRPAAITLGSLALIGLAILATRGLPPISTDFQAMQPSDSEAASTFEEIRLHFPAWGDDRLQLLVTATTADTVAKDSATLESFVEAGLIESFVLPPGLLPNKPNYDLNSKPSLPPDGEREFATLPALVERQSQLRKSVLDAGFSDRAFALSGKILEALHAQGKTQDFRAFSKEVLTNDLTRRSISQNKETGDYLMLGSITLAAPLTGDTLDQLRTLNTPHQTLTGWTTLEPILEPLIFSEFTTLFIPSAVILLLVLLLIFRSWRDTLLSVTILLVVLFLVNTLMSLAGLPWNFLNGMAIPLIIGTGIDYAIHLIFALRRNGGDTADVWRTTGMAICFCGTSTVIGFSSLIFASNDSLRSMGLTCALGVALTMLLSLLLIPAFKRRS